MRMFSVNLTDVLGIYVESLDITCWILLHCRNKKHKHFTTLAITSANNVYVTNTFYFIWCWFWFYLDYVGEASIKEHTICSVRQVTLYPHYIRGCKAITHMFTSSRLWSIMSKAALKSNKTAPKSLAGQTRVAWTSQRLLRALLRDGLHCYLNVLIVSLTKLGVVLICYGGALPLIAQM